MKSLRSPRALTLLFLFFFLCTTLATAFGIYFATLRTIDHLVAQRITDASAMIAPPGEPPEPRRIGDRIMIASRNRDTGHLGFILLERGQQIAGNVQLTRPLPPGLSRVDVADRIKGLSHGLALVRDLGQNLSLAVIAETAPFYDYDMARKHIYFIGFGSILAIALAAATTFSVLIHRRMLHMRRTVDAIFEGDLTRRVPADGSNTAFDVQAQAFNRMLSRINELMDEGRNVTNGVAHELRTPLTRLRNQLSLLIHDPRSAEIRDQIEAAQAEADRLLVLFGALLRIAEVDSGARRANFRSIDLTALVEDCADLLRPLAQETGHRIGLSVEQGISIAGDEQLLSQMVINLIENAASHTPAGTEITVSLASAGSEQALLTVADNGPGIAPQDRARALDRFGRLSAGKGSNGHGFGLPLVASIVRLHGGTLELGDAAPGLEVKVSLPTGQ